MDIQIVALDEALWEAASGIARKVFEETQDITAGVFVLMPGQRTPQEGFSVHEGTEISFVFSGEVLLGLGGNQEQRVRAGDLVLIPKGIPHYSYNSGQQEARILWAIAPAINF